MIDQKNKIDKIILCQNRWKKQTFFNKVQPVVSGIMIFDLDFMKFGLDFSGIYVFDIPIDWILILLFIRVEVNIYGA